MGGNTKSVWMIKEKAALISVAPWIVFSNLFVFSNAETHLWGQMVIFAVLLIGLFLLFSSVLRWYDRFNRAGYGLSAAALGGVYGLLVAVAGFDLLYGFVLVFLALASYATFLYLLEKPSKTSSTTSS